MMKIIITESQYNRLQENNDKTISFFQDLINEKLKYIKENCEGINSEEYNDYIGFETCDEIDLVERIEVKDVRIIRSQAFPYTTTMSTIVLNVEIYYNSIKQSESLSNVRWDLQKILKNYMRNQVEVRPKTINTRKNFDW